MFTAKALNQRWNPFVRVSYSCYISSCKVDQRLMYYLSIGMGVCPQHDVLFDNLTVREHILLASQLKGFSYAQANEEAIRLTNLFHLEKRLGMSLEYTNRFLLLMPILPQTIRDRSYLADRRENCLCRLLYAVDRSLWYWMSLLLAWIH